MRGLLVALYGKNNRAALRASGLASDAPIAKSIAFAAWTRGLIVMAEFVGDKLVVYVESSGGQLREGAEAVWGEIRDQGKDLKPKLRRLQLVDENANDVIAAAAVGIGGNARREDLFVPMATGTATAVVLAAAVSFGHASADFVYGSATALGVAILSLGRFLWSLKSKELVWR